MATTTTTTTFPRFSHLPAELRLQVWEMAAEPRIVSVRIRSQPFIGPPRDCQQQNGLQDVRWVAAAKSSPRQHQLILSQEKEESTDKDATSHDTLTTHSSSRSPSSVAVPAILHASSEARRLGLYQQAYYPPPQYEDEHGDLVTDDMMPPDNRPYIWINWATDVLDIGTQDLRDFLPFRMDIQRLKLSRDNTAIGSWWQFFESSYELRKYANLKQAFVVCLGGGVSGFAHTRYEHAWAKGCEDVFLVDRCERDDLVVRAEDVYDYFKERARQGREVGKLGERYIWSWGGKLSMEKLLGRAPC